MSIRTQVPVTIRDGLKTEIISFAFEGHTSEDIAILFAGWEKQDSALVRIHSECLTGDVFGSQRCDCGPQLQEAIDKMSANGGVLIYLRQEGRGIGLYNKLDAYKLQIENNQDTFEANLHLGLPADSRDYKIVAKMLNDLGISSVRLLTNNPDKVRMLEEEGIKIAEQIPTGVFTTKENVSYLEAKKKHGHTIFDILKGNRG
jgi:GTP cyclohydrolase II